MKIRLLIKELFAPKYDFFIVGSEGTGKTILNKKLRGYEYNKKEDEGTHHDEYKSAIVNIGDKIVKIKKGTDIGGNNNYRTSYNKYIQSDTIIVLLFNIEQYMEHNSNEIRDVSGRIIGIKDLRDNLKNVYIVGTHYDKVETNCSKNAVRQKLINNLNQEGDISNYIDSDHIVITSFGQDDKDKGFLINDKSLNDLVSKLCNMKKEQ